MDRGLGVRDARELVPRGVSVRRRVAERVGNGVDTVPRRVGRGGDAAHRVGDLRRLAHGVVDRRRLVAERVGDDRRPVVAVVLVGRDVTVGSVTGTIPKIDERTRSDGSYRWSNPGSRL